MTECAKNSQDFIFILSYVYYSAISTVLLGVSVKGDYTCTQTVFVCSDQFLELLVGGGSLELGNPPIGVLL